MALQLDMLTPPAPPFTWPLWLSFRVGPGSRVVTVPTGPCRGHSQQHCPSQHSSSVWFHCCVCSQGYLLWNWCWFWHAAPGPHLLFKYHSQGLGGEKKKRERKKTNMKYLLRFGDTHTHVHTTQTHQPGSGSLAVEEGRLWLRLSSKPPWRQSVLKGNPLGQN